MFSSPYVLADTVGLTYLRVQADTDGLADLYAYCTHCKKRFRGIPVPSRDVTSQTLPGRE